MRDGTLGFGAFAVALAVAPRCRGRALPAGSVGPSGLRHRFADQRLVTPQHQERQKNGEENAAFHQRFTGTGSWPAAHSGWQRARRLAASQPPRTSPWRAMASAA